MKPIYIDEYVKDKLFDRLRNEVSWLNREAPRDECFMAFESLEYT